MMVRQDFDMGLMTAVASCLLAPLENEVQDALAFAGLLDNRRPSLAQITAAWLRGLVTAEEAMQAIALHPAMLAEIVRSEP